MIIEVLIEIVSGIISLLSFVAFFYLLKVTRLTGASVLFPIFLSALYSAIIHLINIFVDLQMTLYMLPFWLVFTGGTINFFYKLNKIYKGE